MVRRDWFFIKAHLFVLVVLFSGIIAHSRRLPGNFGDIYSYHYPLRHFMAATLQEGRLPLWNPHIFAGVPAAANPQSILFYPFALLHYILPLPEAFSWDALLHLLLALLGCYVLARRWKIGSVGAWCLSASYGLSPFLVGRLSQGVPTHLSALAWIPWVWLAASGGGVRTFSAPFLLTAVLALQILSGHPQFCLINLIGLGLWVVFRKDRGMAAIAHAGVVALFLVAVQIFPTLEFLGASVRMHWDPQYSVGYSLKLAYLLTFLYPDLWGNPLSGTLRLLPSEFFEMLRLYIGIIPLGVGLYGLVRVRSLWALLGAGVFLALGHNNPAFMRVHQWLGLEMLRVPARSSLLILWGLWLGAAAGWRSLQESPKGHFWRRALPIMAGLTVCDLLAWSIPWIYPQSAQEFLAPQTALARFLNGGSRIATSPEVPAPNKSMMYRIPNVTGYEAFYPQLIATYTSRSERGPSADGSRTYVLDWKTAEMSKLGVRYYVAPKDEKEARAAFRSGETRVYENPNFMPLVRGAPEWRIVAPEHWIVWAKPPTVVYFSQPYYPGWKAWVDGIPTPVWVEDGIFSGVSVPREAGAGKISELHFRFLPESWFVGLFITLATLLWMAFLAVARVG